MYAEEKKLHIIEEVLKTTNEATLSALEEILERSKKKVSDKAGFSKFSGIWSKGEAEEIERIIAESCETVNPDDWK